MNAISRIFEATDAIRGDETLMAGIVAPSGGGKTWSALRVAVGIQQVVGGDIYGIDTENGRMKQYADYFKFKHVPFSPPFGSMDYLAAIKYCHGKGGRIIIVDSMTHEHVGEGGYLETADATVTRIAGANATWAQREKVQMLGWGTAGPLRTKMIEGIKQLGGNYIFCWRAKQRVKPMKINGKIEVVEMGLMPIGGEEWVYEMTVNCLLDARANGVPRWTTERLGERMMMKLPQQFTDIFAEPRPLSEDIGRAMAEWAKGGGTAAPIVDLTLRAQGNEAAGRGKAAFAQFWNGLGREQRISAGGAPQRNLWLAAAKKADEAPPPGDDLDLDDLPEDNPPSPPASSGEAQDRPADSAATEPAGGVSAPAEAASQEPLGAALVPPAGAAPSLADVAPNDPGAWVEAAEKTRRANIRRDGDARAAAGTAALADFIEGLRKAGEADLVSPVLASAWHDSARAADAAKGRKG